MNRKKKRILLLLPVVLALVAFGAMRRDDEQKTAHKSLAASKEEARILSVIEELYDEPNGLWNVPPADGRLLRILAESRNAKNVVELGTSNGCSALWFCLALRKTGGKLTTHEIDLYRVSLARENFRRAGVAEIATVVDGNAHETVRDINEPIDILFLDADKDGYLDYLNKLLWLVRDGGMIIAHNTTDQASQMPDFLEAITTNPDLETAFVHDQPNGMSITLKKRRY